MPKNMTVGDVDIEWLGHASFRFKADNKVIYVDPFKIPGGEKADIILITHDHYDHCDPGSINSVKKPETIVIGPESCSSKIPEIRKIKSGETISLKDIEIKAVPAYNIGKSFHPRGSGVGFVVKIAGKTIYHAGDTDRIPEMENLKNIDVALLPAGGTYTMNAEEAAEAANVIKPAIAIPMHWGKIIGSKEDAIKFKDLCKVQVKVLD
jgi:L-ascorbate metabolism protein UlaG (beta-lactamase superfamily)